MFSADSELELVDYQTDENGLIHFTVPDGDNVVQVAIRPLKRQDTMLIQDMDQRSPTAEEELMSLMIAKWGDRNGISIMELTEKELETTDPIQNAISKFIIFRYDFIHIHHAGVLKETPQKCGKIRYQRGAQKKLILHDIPQDDGFITVELRPLKKKDKYPLQGLDPKAIGTNEKLLSLIITKWGDRNEVSVEELLEEKNTPATIILSQAINRFFRKEYKFIEKRGRDLAKSSVSNN